MPTPTKYKAPFIPGILCHITFRSIDGLLLFQDHKDYLLFLRQFANYFHPFLDTLAYSLLKNHTHFIVQIKERERLLEQIRATPDKFRTCAMNKVLVDSMNDQLIDQMIERQANSFMASYVKLKNQDIERKGGLFQSPFRRSFIENDGHLQQAVIYVHANAQKHRIVKDYKEYLYSSYHEILAGNSTNVRIPKVLGFFGGRNRFIELHKAQVDHFYKHDWLSPVLEIRSATGQ